jgi:hypothetical protein
MSGWRWTGRCIGGIYLGARTFLRSGRTVRGAFGMEGVNGEEPCQELITARCQLSEAGRLLPFWWLACDNPDHRSNAGVIENLDAHGRVTSTVRMLGPKLSEEPPIQIEAVAEVVGEPKKRKRKVKKRRPKVIDVTPTRTPT